MRAAMCNQPRWKRGTSSVRFRWRWSSREELSSLSLLSGRDRSRGVWCVSRFAALRWFILVLWCHEEDEKNRSALWRRRVRVRTRCRLWALACRRCEVPCRKPPAAGNSRVRDEGEGAGGGAASVCFVHGMVVWRFGRRIGRNYKHRIFLIAIQTRILIKFILRLARSKDVQNYSRSNIAKSWFLF